MSIHEGFLDSNPHAVQIHGISDSLNENDPGSLLKSWDIIGIDSEGIDVELNFKDALAVSKGEEPD